MKKKSRARTDSLTLPRDDEAFFRASAAWDTGELRRAFRIFLGGAKQGESGCQLNLALFYDEGIGIKRNRTKALYWNRRAYRQGNAGAANNIGLMFKEEGDIKKALLWLHRALKMGDEGVGLKIAKILLKLNRPPEEVIHYLAITASGTNVTEAGCEEAERMIRRLRKMKTRR